MKTLLNDRILWYDGTNEVEPEKVPDLLLMGVNPAKIVVSEMNDDISKFNMIDFEEIISQGKLANDELGFAWNIPLKYQTLDLDEYILERAHAKGEKYVIRAMEELLEIRTRGLGSIFKTLIFIIDVLCAKKQLWGVGRGSSCASLVLHLINVHEVDPVRFNIPKEEFFHG